MSDLFVYRITSEFGHPGRKGYYLEDLATGQDVIAYSHEESGVDLGMITLVNDIAQRQSGRERLRYDGTQRQISLCMDGYLGRPTAYSYAVRKLERPEILALERALDVAEQTLLSLAASRAPSAN